MNTKILYGVLAGVVILVVGLLIYNQSRKDNVNSLTLNNNNAAEQNLNNSNTVDNTNISENTNTNTSQNNNNSNSHYSGEGDIQGKTVAVDYNGTSFSPSTITIKAGDTVVFKNMSSNNFWPASDPHPTHTNYPGFDALKAYAPGSLYQFTFTKVGTWGYHNHLNPSQKGTIIVQ